MKTLFPQLADVVVEQVTADRQVVRVRARTRKVAVSCPGCGKLTRRVHGYHLRRLADVRSAAAASSNCASGGWYAKPADVRGRRS